MKGKPKLRIVAMATVLLLTCLLLWWQSDLSDLALGTKIEEEDSGLSASLSLTREELSDSHIDGAEPIRRPLDEQDSQGVVILRRVEYQSLVPGLSLFYGRHLPFGDGPYTYRQLHGLFGKKDVKAMQAVEQRPGSYAVPIPGEKWYLWLEDEFDYLAGSNALTSSDLDETEAVRFVKAGCSCRGRVVDSKGKPIEGAFVGAAVIASSRSSGGALGALASLRIRFAETGPLGEFLMTGLPADTKHRLVFATPGAAPTRREMPKTPPYTQYLMSDTVLQDGSALLIEVVTQSSTSPIEGARVIAQPGPGVPRMDTSVLLVQTDSDGRARVGNLASGIYSITVLADGREPERRRVEVREGKNVSIRMKMRSGKSLLGRVVDKASGAPVSGASVSAQAGGFALPLWAEPRLRTDNQGRFVFASAPKHSMTVTVAARGYVSSKKHVDAETVVVEIALAKEATIVVFPRLLDGTACQKYLLTVRREQSNSRPIIRNVSNSGAGYRLGGLLPKERILLIVESEFQSGQVFCDAVKEGAVVVVPLRAKIVVSGHIYDDSGKPLAGVEIRRLRSADKLNMMAKLIGLMTRGHAVKSGEDGSFSLRVAAGKDHVIEFTRSDLEASRKVIRGQQGLQLTQTLHRLPQVSGIVQSGPGRPVVDAYVFAVSKSRVPLRYVQTDKAGKFALSLQRGVKQVHLRIVGRQSRGTTWSTIVSARSGDVLIVEKPKTNSNIRGRVIGVDDRDVLVVATLMDEYGGKRDRTRPRCVRDVGNDGRFEMNNLMDGQYVLRVLERGKGKGRTLATIDVSVMGEGVDGLVINIKSR